MSEYLDWKVGDEVVCVDAVNIPKQLEFGAIYTIRKIGIEKGVAPSSHLKTSLNLCIWVNEFQRPSDVGMNVLRFRKVQKHKTDISIFKSMLNKSPEENNKELVESQVKDMIDA